MEKNRSSKYDKQSAASREKKLDQRLDEIRRQENAGKKTLYTVPVFADQVTPEQYENDQQLQTEAEIEPSEQLEQLEKQLKDIRWFEQNLKVSLERKFGVPTGELTEKLSNCRAWGNGQLWMTELFGATLTISRPQQEISSTSFAIRRWARMVLRRLNLMRSQLRRNLTTWTTR